MTRYNLARKVIIVTGGAKGIGRHIAQSFGKEGAFVAVNDINVEALENVVGEINDSGGLAIPVSGDITVEGDVKHIFAKTIERFGTVDILVNNAGVSSNSLVDKMTNETWDSVINTNLTGSFNCLREACKYMKERGRGNIINVSSVVANGNIGTVSYGAAKAGVIGLTKSAALELIRYGIRVNCIMLGYVQAGLFYTITEKLQKKMIDKIPIGRTARPEEITNVILFLASDCSSYIIGESMIVDGGYSLGSDIAR